MNLKQKLTRLIKESLANKLSEYDTSGLHSPHIANDGQFDDDEIGDTDDDSVNKSLNKDINVVQSVLGAIHNESVNEARAPKTKSELENAIKDAERKLEKHSNSLMKLDNAPGGGNWSSNSKEGKAERKLKNAQGKLRDDIDRWNKKLKTVTEGKPITMGKDVFDVIKKSSGIWLINRKNKDDKYGFKTEKQLNAFLDDYTEPIKGRQSSYFGEAVNENSNFDYHIKVIKKAEDYLALNGMESVGEIGVFVDKYLRDREIRPTDKKLLTSLEFFRNRLGENPNPKNTELGKYLIKKKLAESVNESLPPGYAKFLVSLQTLIGNIAPNAWGNKSQITPSDVKRIHNSLKKKYGSDYKKFNNMLQTQKGVFGHWYLKESINEEVLTEGVNDPNILKAVFLAGGPGSGKSFSAEQVFGIDNIMKGTSTLGLKVVNSDPAFEQELKKRGVDPKNLGKMTDKIFNYYTSDKSGSARDKAKKIKTKLERMYHEGRLGLIVDGTGHDYGKLAKKKQRLEELGYDTSMLFINTTLPVALERNNKRERVLPAKVVKTSWKDVQANLGKFKTLFGSNFYTIDNSEFGNFNKMHGDKIKAIVKMLKSPLKNPIGKQWIEDEKKLRSLGS